MPARQAPTAGPMTSFSQSTAKSVSSSITLPAKCSKPAGRTHLAGLPVDHRSSRFLSMHAEPVGRGPRGISAGPAGVCAVRPAADAVLRAHEDAAAAQFVAVGAVLGRDLLPSLAGPSQIHGSLPQ